MPDRWSWTPEEWARIECIARLERDIKRTLGNGGQSPIARKAMLALARGAALELRQWAGVAIGHGYASAMMRAAQRSQINPAGIPSGQAR